MWRFYTHPGRPAAEMRCISAMLGQRAESRLDRTGVEIARAATSRPVVDAAHDLGLSEVDLQSARALVQHAEASSTSLRPLYDWSDGVEDGISAVTRTMYGADSVSCTHKARRDLQRSKSRVYVGSSAAKASRVDRCGAWSNRRAFVVPSSLRHSGCGLTPPIGGEIPP